MQSAYALFLERYNGCGDPLAWLYTTVKREAWAMRRRTSRRRECSLDSPGDAERPNPDWTEAVAVDAPNPEESACRNMVLEERRQALAELKPDERRALWLLGLGLSYAEICEATGWTYTKVNRSLSEGRSALRNLLTCD